MRQKPQSRQRLYQIKREKEGRCQVCGRIAFKAGECRRHYVLRAMHRLAPEIAEELTFYILRKWAVLESMGLRPGYEVTPSPKVSRWINKWIEPIGGANA